MKPSIVRQNRWGSRQKRSGKGSVEVFMQRMVDPTQSNPPAQLTDATHNDPSVTFLPDGYTPTVRLEYMRPRGK